MIGPDFELFEAHVEKRQQTTGFADGERCAIDLYTSDAQSNILLGLLTL
jgi:hypothetical protein